MPRVQRILTGQPCDSSGRLDLTPRPNQIDRSFCCALACRGCSPPDHHRDADRRRSGYGDPDLPKRMCRAHHPQGSEDLYKRGHRHPSFHSRTQHVVIKIINIIIHRTGDIGGRAARPNRGAMSPAAGTAAGDRDAGSPAARLPAGSVPPRPGGAQNRAPWISLSAAPNSSAPSMDNRPQSPAGPVSGDIEPVRDPQMLTQHLRAKPALEPNDVI